MKKFVSHQKLICLISLVLFSTLAHAKRFQPNAPAPRHPRVHANPGRLAAARIDLADLQRMAQVLLAREIMRAAGVVLPYSPALPSAIGIFAQDPTAIRQDMLQMADDLERVRDQLQQQIQNQQ